MHRGKKHKTKNYYNNNIYSKKYETRVGHKDFTGEAKCGCMEFFCYLSPLFCG